MAVGMKREGLGEGEVGEFLGQGQDRALLPGIELGGRGAVGSLEGLLVEGRILKADLQGPGAFGIDQVQGLAVILAIFGLFEHGTGDPSETVDLETIFAGLHGSQDLSLCRDCGLFGCRSGRGSRPRLPGCGRRGGRSGRSGRSGRGIGRAVGLTCLGSLREEVAESDEYEE